MGAKRRVRRRYQRLENGRCVSHIKNPFSDGRIKLSARSPEELADKKREIDALEEQVRRAFALAEVGRMRVEDAARENDEAARYVAHRFGRRRVETTPKGLGDLFGAYMATLRTVGAKRKALSAWRHQIAPLLGDLYTWELSRARMVSWELALRSASAPNSSSPAGHRPATRPGRRLRARRARLRRAERAERKAYAASTIRVAFELLRAAHILFEISPAWGSWRPKKGKRAPREAARDPGELELLVKAALGRDLVYWRKGLYADLAYRVIVIALCGLRQGEAAGLGWDHVDLLRRTVTVRYQAIDGWKTLHPAMARPLFPVKNEKHDGPAHEQALHDDAYRVLVAQKAQLEKFGWYRPDGPVFPHHEGRIIDVRAAGQCPDGSWKREARPFVTGRGAWRPNNNCIDPRAMRTLAAQAGVRNASAWVVHSLRASFATLEILSGQDPKSAQARTGHATMRALEAYVYAPRGLVKSRIPELPSVKLAADLVRLGKESP